MTGPLYFLTPSKDWRVRVYSPFLFVILDYVMTGLFCVEFSNEGNRLLRAFMISADSVPLGLLIFTVSFYGPVYVLLCRFTKKSWDSLMGASFFQLLSEHVRPLYDVAFGLGVASRHFEGAMSWVLPLSNRLWLALGFVFYLFTVHIGTLIDRFRS